MAKEVVITGMGIVSSLGNTPEEFFNNLIQGKSGVGLISRFDTEKYSVKIGAEVTDFDPSPYIPPKEISRTSRYIQYALHASVSAVQNAGIEKGGVEKSRAGVIFGSGMGGIEVFTHNAVALENRSPSRVSPFFIPQAITNMAAGYIGINLGWMGPNWSITSACATSNHAFMSAADTIRMDRADVMIAGGSEESVCPVSLAGFANMRALSRRNDAPEKASRPFDRDRDGFVLGEGAGAMVLESREHAQARGAKILGVILGYGSSCDAHHMSQPLETGEGVSIGVEQAIREAGISKEDIGVINGHSTSTPLGDVAEVKALKKVFGSHIQNIKFPATKSMAGHLLGAASAAEGIATVLCLNHGRSCA
jgi:3-oxoacyl-[acyl-carrier-protein] synthase II